MRQMPYFRSVEWGRPQILQRLYARVENFGLRAAFKIMDFFAIFSSY
jgi:hypothetical protein